jgi:hypothetical protein
MVFALFVFVLWTLCCHFIWIVHFELPLRYSLMFIYQFAQQIARNGVTIAFRGVCVVQFLVIQYEDKQSKNTTQYVLDTTRYKQTHIAYIRHEPFYKQLGVKTNRTLLVCGNRHGHFKWHFIVHVSYK